GHYRTFQHRNTSHNRQTCRKPTRTSNRKILQQFPLFFSTKQNPIGQNRSPLLKTCRHHPFLRETLWLNHQALCKHQQVSTEQLDPEATDSPVSTQEALTQPGNSFTTSQDILTQPA